MMKKFKCSFSRSMLVSTVSVLLLLVIAIFVGVKKVMAFPYDSPLFIAYIVALAIIGISIVVAYATQIDYIGVTDDDLIIKRYIGSTVIKRKDIVEIKRKKNMTHDIRLFGISGVFGHTGLFYSSALGRYVAYAKDGDSLFSIKTPKKTFVVSCDEYEQLLSELRD